MLTDADYMARALFHAERGRGRTTPNPLVGAVVVADEVVVGQGYHERAGEPHAEIHALDAAGPRARGATLYCTLEPCAHTGRTGPCVQRIVEAGITRVVAALEDPHPLVSGAGFEYLRGHGVRVEVGVGKASAIIQNAPFLSVVRRKRPFVVAKIATSLDGRVAGANGQRVQLTSAAANRRVHALRASVDAVVVGSGTLLADDPLLTCRGAYRERPLIRAILDRRLRTLASARIFSTLDAGPVIILTGESARQEKSRNCDALARAGAIVEAVSDVEATRAAPLTAMLERLVAHDVCSVLIEGGAEIHRAAFAEGLIDRVHVIVTPHHLGDGGVRWVDFDAVALTAPAVSVVGPDVWLEANVHWTD